MLSPEELNARTEKIIGAAMKVHTFLGPGLLESTYEACLCYELRKRGFTVQTQFPIRVVYDEVDLEVGYRADLLVDDCVIVELKVVDKIIAVHEAQLVSYLRLSGIRVGLLINFQEVHLKDGLRRRVNNL